MNKTGKTPTRDLFLIPGVDRQGILDATRLLSKGDWYTKGEPVLVHWHTKEECTEGSKHTVLCQGKMYEGTEIPAL